MSENQLLFLCNIASKLRAKNDTHKFLKSYYLMRCKEVTKGYGLPAKHFSSTVRCPHCCLEWTRDSDVKVKPLKLNKRQRQRIRVENILNKQNQALHRNIISQTCTFCQHSTTTQSIKPEREYFKAVMIKEHTISRVQANNQTKQEKNSTHKKIEVNNKKTNVKQEIKKKDSVKNLYTNAFDVFSLKNDNNTILSTIKEPPKVIKNNKKRKDKFAGLCQKAVIASAKLKKQKEKKTSLLPQNKLNLFLKPSLP